jgi:maleylacetate reductase
VRAFRYEALPGRVVFGAGSSRWGLVDEVDGERVLLIATKRAEPLARELAAPLGDRVAGIFTGVREHVPGEVAEAARAMADDVSADWLLAVGGGSTIGTAKIIALDHPMPIVAVPTTYAGSEMTPVWGSTDGNRKKTGRSDHVLPRAVVYDPELTTSLPPRITATSGMNAMAHCVEAGYAPGANPISTLVAEEAIRALGTGLPRSVECGGDLDGRAEVLYGAHLAGAAFASAGAGLHHKLCHLLGGTYDLPHAETHTVLLPHVASLVEPGAPEVMRRFAVALGAESVGDGLRRLVARIGAPTSLRDIGMREEDVPEAARLAAAAVPDGTPVPVDEKTLRELLERAL